MGSSILVLKRSSLFDSQLNILFVCSISDHHCSKILLVLIDCIGKRFFRGICSRYRLMNTHYCWAKRETMLVQCLSDSIDRFLWSMNKISVTEEKRQSHWNLSKRLFTYLLRNSFIHFLELIIEPAVVLMERWSSSYLCWNVDERICEITRMTEGFLSERIEGSIEIVR